MINSHSSFKRFAEEIWPFIIRIIGIVTGKRFRSCENRIGLTALVAIQKRIERGSAENISEIFYSLLFQSIIEKHANIEKISNYESEDIARILRTFCN
jgi:hypothetical protein